MRNRAILALAIAGALTLGGCGGGGGGSRSSSGQGGGPITPTANVTVAITSPAINASILADDPYSTTVSGTWNATNLGSGAVYLQVADSAGTFALPAVQVAPANNSFSYSLSLASGLAAGERNGTITVRACKDTACNSTYAGTSGSVGYRLTVGPVPDWETLQGNAAHNGYVPVTIDVNKIAKAWEWTAPISPGMEYSYISNPVTGSDGVFVGIDNPNGPAFASFDETTGNQLWFAPYKGATYGTTYPAYSSGKLYFGAANTMNPIPGLVAWDLVNPANGFSSWAISEAAGFEPPTPQGGKIYIQEWVSVGGHVRLVSADSTTGTPQWSIDLPESETRARTYFTPAVDNAYVYYHSACCLEFLDKSSGARIARIQNPSADATYTGIRSTTTILGTRGNVLGLAYNVGRTKRLLSSFDITTRSLKWTSSEGYSAYPAVANGVVYATSLINGRPVLHALDEATGQKLWEWTPPESEGQTKLYGNVVATRNLVFFSTYGTDFYSDTARTWAIDLNTHQVVWNFPAAGTLAISANRMLYVVRGAPTFKADTLLAFKTN